MTNPTATRTNIAIATTPERRRAEQAPAETAREHTSETLHETVARESAERAAGRPARPCTEYPGCEEVDTHEDHTGHEFRISPTAENSDPLIWACLTHLADSTAYVSLNGDDLSPQQAREKAAELRKLADAMEEMADQAQNWRALINLRKVQETAGPAFGQILGIVEKAIVVDGADSSAVWDEVLDLMQRSHAKARA